MSKNRKTTWKKDDRVVARASGWEGTVVKINEKNPSSPLRVKWDKNGEESNENSMSVRRKLPEGTTRDVDIVFREATAKSDVELLTEHGIRASYERRSAQISWKEGEEPAPEWYWAIRVTYVHIDEFNCAKRILRITD